MPATNKLIEGYRRFRQGFYRKNKDLMRQLATEGQSPKIAIISCCDSRVDPTIIMDCQPGDLFVVRNVANLVPPCEVDDHYHGTSSALEFAVTGLNVESIIVLGHAQCGGIKALIDNPVAAQPKSFIATWMNQLESVRNEILADDSLTTQEQRYHACEQRGITYSLANLMSFPWISDRVYQGQLRLHGWYYDLNSAGLYAFDQVNGGFRKVS